MQEVHWIALSIRTATSTPTLVQAPCPERTAAHRHSFIGFNLGARTNDLADGMSIDVAYDLDLEGGAYGSWERFRLRDIATPAAL